MALHCRLIVLALLHCPILFSTVADASNMKAHESLLYQIQLGLLTTLLVSASALDWLGDPWGSVPNPDDLAFSQLGPHDWTWPLSLALHTHLLFSKTFIHFHNVTFLVHVSINFAAKSQVLNIVRNITKCKSKSHKSKSNNGDTYPKLKNAKSQFWTTNQK